MAYCAQLGMTVCLMQIRRAIACLAALAVIVAIAVFVWRASWHAPGRNTSAGTAPWTAVPEQTLSHGRFENLTVYAPETPPRGFVLLLSGADGWTADMAETARQFVRQGALVAGIDTRQLAANLEADGADCIFPDGDLENLSHFVQAYYRLPAYLLPILAGKATGAALAYATLAQAPAKTFGGALSIGFCPVMTLRKPLCKSGGLDFIRTRTAASICCPRSSSSIRGWSSMRRAQHRPPRQPRPARPPPAMRRRSSAS